MVRSGQTWHVGKALQYGRTYYGLEVHRNACIHCGEEDGNGHMLGGCKHLRLQGAYNEKGTMDLACRPFMQAHWGPAGRLLISVTRTRCPRTRAFPRTS